MTRATLRYNQVTFWKQGEPLTIIQHDYAGRKTIGPYIAARDLGGKAWRVWGLREGVSARVLTPAIRENFRLKREAMAAIESMVRT